MRPLRPYTISCLVELFLAIGFLIVSLPTRGWLTAEVIYPIVVDVSVGLFWSSVGDEVIATKDLKQFRDYDPIHTTIILLCIGLAMLVLATAAFVVTLFKSPNVVFLTLQTICSLAAGIFILASTILIDVKYVNEYLDKGFSWWFALVSGVLALSSIGSLGAALKRGEIDRTASASNVQRIY